MRDFSRSLAALLLVGCPALVKAVTIRVQDPNYTNIASTPSTFTFSTCPTRSPYMDNGMAITSNGCFGAQNGSGSSISSIELTFANTPAIQRSGPDNASSDIFSSVTVVPPRDPSDPSENLTFLFSGGLLAPGENFVITEDGVKNPDRFPVVTLNYTTVTPEPSSFLLMCTGLLGAGGIVYRRRHA